MKRLARGAGCLGRNSVVGVLAVAVALTPAPFLFGCACTCGSGSPVPGSSLPEAPWQPFLIGAGLMAALLVYRHRRGGGGQVPPTSGSGGGRRAAGRPARVGLAAARVTLLVLLLSVASGTAAAAGVAASPQATATAGPCDCPPADAVGGVAAAVSSPVPDAGAPSLLLRVALPLLAGGASLAGGAYLVRPRHPRV